MASSSKRWRTSEKFNRGLTRQYITSLRLQQHLATTITCFRVNTYSGLAVTNTIRNARQADKPASGSAIVQQSVNQTCSLAR